MAGTSTKEDSEAEQAKSALLEKQKEKDFLAEVQARQQQSSELRQQQEQQQQQQQDNGLDSSYYQAPQVELPNYQAIQYEQSQTQALVPQEQQQQFQYGGRKLITFEDPRKINATTGKAIDPNVDLKSGDYNDAVVRKLIEAANKHGVDPYTAVSVGLQETGLGKSDDNIGHITGEQADKHSNASSDEESLVLAIKDKLAYANRLGIKDEATKIQAYNGLGNVYPSTESGYHGFNMQKIYGVPLSKQGINMRKNPLYGKRIIDLRENVVKNNPTVKEYIRKVKSHPFSGQIDETVPNPLSQYFKNGGLTYAQNGTTFFLENMQNQLTPNSKSYANVQSFDQLAKGEDNTIYKGAPLEEVVVKAPRKKIPANGQPFKINLDESTLREAQVVRDNIPTRKDLGVYVTKRQPKQEEEWIKQQIIYSDKLHEQEAAKKAKEFNDFSKEIKSKSVLVDATKSQEIPLDINNYKTEKDVANLQKTLTDKGYNLNPEGKFTNNGIDGKLGKVTMDAMINYNKHNSDSGYASIKEGTGMIGKCQEAQCSEYMQNELYRNVQPNISREEWNKKTGLHGNAWDIGENIINSGGSKVEKNKVKSGDVVTMFTGGMSEYQGEANAAGTGTTHTGLIDEVNPDGSYYILHNVHSKDRLTGEFKGREFRDLVKDGKIVSGGLKRSFEVRSAFRPDYKEVQLGEKKVLDDNIKLTLDPKKAVVLSSKEYDNNFTSANAKNKLLNTFIKPLNDTRNKKVMAKVFGLGDDEYQSLAKVTLGILGQESSFGTNAKYTTGYKEVGATLSKLAGYLPPAVGVNELAKASGNKGFIKTDEVSKGAGRLKYETNFGKDDVTELGITEDNFDDEDKAPLTTMYKVATDYKRFLKKGYNKKDAMYRAITVYNVSLGHVSGGKTTEEWAKNYDVDYTNKVLNYSNFFNTGDNKKQYKTTTDELLLHPNVYKWRSKLKKEKKL